MANPYDAPESDSTPNGTLAATSLQMIRVAQIITAALAMGAFVFLVVILTMKKGAIDGAPSITSWFMIGFGLLLVVLHLVIPASSTRMAIERIDSESFASLDEEGKFGRLFGIFNTQQIIACALLEGGAFANIGAYLISDGFIGNLAAAAVLIGLILIRFPTENNARNWVQTRSREIIARA